MIPVAELIYEIDFQLNKLSTLENQFIPLENKLISLNNSQIKIVKNKIGLNNVYQIGFDGFKKRYEDLQHLVEPFDKHEVTFTLEDKHLNKWVTSTSSLPEYMFYIDAYLLAIKNNCKERRLKVNHALTKHGDVQTLLSNKLYKPSFEYKETFSTLSSDKIEIYTDGSFTPTNGFISYLRYPIPIDAVGWQKFDGTDSVDQDSELPYYLKDELVNLTIKELADITENVPLSNIARENATKNE